jgi:UrcA family protein
METHMNTKIAGALLSALALGFATVASAHESESPPQVVVKYGDLDISTSQGAATLYRRIQGAATNVCSQMYVSQEAFRVRKDSCLQKVIGDAVAKVNQPELSAVFASKYGTPPPIVVAAAGARQE